MKPLLERVGDFLIIAGRAFDGEEGIAPQLARCRGGNRVCGWLGVHEGKAANLEADIRCGLLRDVTACIAFRKAKRKCELVTVRLGS